jgi:hypothetical protein
MRPAILLLAASLAAGCHTIIPGTTSGTRIPSDRSLPKGLPTGGQPDPARESSKKRVSAKEEPGTLIASDRSQCFVAADEFRKVSVGESYSCTWSPAPTRPVVAR